MPMRKRGFLGKSKQVREWRGARALRHTRRFQRCTQKLPKKAVSAWKPSSKSSPMHISPTNVTIDPAALVHNLQQIRLLVGRSCKIMGVVKSDAYGHGLVPASRTLEQCRIDCLGVGDLEEALELRKRGIHTPVVILAGISTGEACDDLVENELIPVVFDLSAAEGLNRMARKRNKRATVYLKVDTGMGRLGILPGELGNFLNRVSTMKNLFLQGLMSHLSSADESDRDFTVKQIRRFTHAVEEGRSRGFPLPTNHLANSAGIMRFQDSHFEMVRPGIMLYGGLPNPGFQTRIRLKPAMRFACGVLQLKTLPANSPVGYGRTYQTVGPRTVAVLSAGYGNGLPRTISNRGNVLIRGVRAPILGRISMNLTVCDVTGIEHIKPGDEAVFLGEQDGDRISADELAGSAGTISYEVFCSLGRSNRRNYP